MITAVRRCSRPIALMLPAQGRPFRRHDVDAENTSSPGTTPRDWRRPVSLACEGQREADVR